MLKCIGHQEKNICLLSHKKRGRLNECLRENGGWRRRPVCPTVSKLDRSCSFWPWQNFWLTSCYWISCPRRLPLNSVAVSVGQRGGLVSLCSVKHRNTVREEPSCCWITKTQRRQADVISFSIRKWLLLCSLRHFQVFGCLASAESWCSFYRHKNISCNVN